MNELLPATAKQTYQGNTARILELLGNGLAPEVVASAAGVTPSYVSQLLSSPDFSAQVTELRFANLQDATARDKRYDSLEDKVMEKLEQSIDMCYKPMELVRVMQVVNGAKRRGASAPEHTAINNTVVNLVMPVQIMQRFTTDANNQVVEVASGEEIQTLVTMSSSMLLKNHELKTVDKIVGTPDNIINPPIKELSHAGNHRRDDRQVISDGTT
jgi:hypothetical protein